MMRAELRAVWSDERRAAGSAGRWVAMRAARRGQSSAVWTAQRTADSTVFLRVESTAGEKVCHSVVQKADVKAAMTAA